jgi:hypothetical protein
VQPSLFQTAPRFHGADFVVERDQVRLGEQQLRVLAVLKDGQWHTVNDIQARIYIATGKRDPENSIQAQCRNLRKPEHGGYNVPRERHAGVSVYRLVEAAR